MTDCDRRPHLHVYPERAMWRWTYHEPGGADGQELALQSSIAFAGPEEARSAAASAYPGIPITDEDEQTAEAATDQEHPAKHRCRRGVPAVLAAAVLVATTVIILRQRAVDDHGRDRPEPPRFGIAFGPGFRVRFRLRRPGVSAAVRRSPAAWWEDVVMVDMTKCTVALPRSSRARRVGGRR